MYGDSDTEEEVEIPGADATDASKHGVEEDDFEFYGWMEIELLCLVFMSQYIPGGASCTQWPLMMRCPLQIDGLISNTLYLEQFLWYWPQLNANRPHWL